MLNEPASTVNDRRPRPSVDESFPAPLKPKEDERLDAVRVAVMQVMAIAVERRASEIPPDDQRGGSIIITTRDAKILLRFEGRLLTDAESAFEALDAQFMPLNLTPVLREVDGVQHVYAIDSRAAPEPRRWYLNAVLFLITLFSVMYVGADLRVAEIAFDQPLLGIFMRGDFYNRPLSYLHYGFPYALAILLILGAHEMGHYVAARRRGLAVTLPYFLPFPLGFTGTLGAFIQLREPIKNRKVLFEVGAAGPLAGLIFAIPILFIGLATSPTAPVGPGYVEGNSLFYAFAKFLVFGDWIPNAQFDVMLNQLAWAGWTGLLITGLNLLPVGQLDGGHILYSLIGERAKTYYFPAMGALIALTLVTNGGLIVMLILLLLFGRTYAVPLNNITPLDPRRRALAIFTLIVFVLVFVPIPLSIREPEALTFGLAPAAALVVTAARALRR